MGNKRKKKKRKKSKPQKQRSLIAMNMILNRKGGFMHDRREERGGAKNKQVEILKEASCEDSKK